LSAVATPPTSARAEAPVGARNAWRIRDWYVVGGAAAVFTNWLSLYPETRHDVGSFLGYATHFPPFVIVSLAWIAVVTPFWRLVLLLLRRSFRRSSRAVRASAWIAAVGVGAAAMHYPPFAILFAYEVATSNGPTKFVSPDPFFTLQVLFMQGATSLSFFSVPLLFRRFRTR